MNLVKVVNGPFRVFTGRVELTEAQAKERGHLLRESGAKGVYEVVKPIEFKVGEVFGYDGTLPKNGNVVEVGGRRVDVAEDQSKEKSKSIGKGKKE